MVNPTKTTAVKVFRFNPKTDKYVAEFVYLRKLDVEVSTADMVDYEKSPNRFHSQWLGPLTRSFFESPWPSVAEVWPSEKMGG